MNTGLPARSGQNIGLDIRLALGKYRADIGQNLPIPTWPNMGLNTKYRDSEITFGMTSEMAVHYNALYFVLWVYEKS